MKTVLPVIAIDFVLVDNETVAVIAESRFFTQSPAGLFGLLQAAVDTDEFNVFLGL